MCAPSLSAPVHPPFPPFFNPSPVWSSTGAFLFLESVMSKFTRSNPATTVDLYTEVTNQIITALEAGTIDARRYAVFRSLRDALR